MQWEIHIPDSLAWNMKDGLRALLLEFAVFAPSCSMRVPYTDSTSRLIVEQPLPDQRTPREGSKKTAAGNAPSDFELCIVA